jgi:hypothetical protein
MNGESSDQRLRPQHGKQFAEFNSSGRGLISEASAAKNSDLVERSKMRHRMRDVNTKNRAIRRRTILQRC